MKRILIIALALLLFSCSMEKGYVSVNNKTTEDAIVRYASQTGSRDIKVRALESEIIEESINGYEDAYVISPEGIKDNGRSIAKAGINLDIHSLEHCSYSFKVLVPSSAFDGSESLYIAERDNRIERFPTVKTVIKLEADSYLNITSYGHNFYLCDKDGNAKNTLNGCPVTIQTKGNQLIIL